MVHKKIREYIQEWEKKCYHNGIPDDAPIELGDKVPSYRRICIAILKNDFNLNSLGFESKKSKYYNMLKRIEIDARPCKYKQLKIKFNESNNRRKLY